MKNPTGNEEESSNVSSVRQRLVDDGIEVPEKKLLGGWYELGHLDQNQFLLRIDEETCASQSAPAVAPIAAQVLGCGRVDVEAET